MTWIGIHPRSPRGYLEVDMPRILKAVFLFLLTGVLAGCGTFKVFQTKSRPLEQPIEIDGKSDDWTGSLYVVDGEPVTLGFKNDEENLYVCLFAESNITRDQILRRGLTVWFDPQGGQKKTLGIKYPVGMRAGERKATQQGDEQKEPELVPKSEDSKEELEIIHSEKEKPETMRLDQLQGVELKTATSTGLLVYELKIPLIPTKQHPFAVGAQPGKTLGIGFETGKSNPDQMSRGDRDGMPGGGGRPPMGGGRGGIGGGAMGGGERGGRGGYGREPEFSEGLKIWTLVRLSSGVKSQKPTALSVSIPHD